jgi:hypothetical protein
VRAKDGPKDGTKDGANDGTNDTTKNGTNDGTKDGLYASCETVHLYQIIVVGKCPQPIGHSEKDEGFPLHDFTISMLWIYAYVAYNRDLDPTEAK